MKKPKLKKSWMTSNECHFAFGTLRQWLREKWEQGLIKRREIEGVAYDGTPRIRYLYCVDDVVNELKKSETKGEQY